MAAWLRVATAFLAGAWRRLPVETLAVGAAVASAIAMVHDADELWPMRVLFAALIAAPLALSLHGRGRRVALLGGGALAALVLGAMILALPGKAAADSQGFLWPYGLSLVTATLLPFVVAAPRFTTFVRRFFEEVTTFSLLAMGSSAAIAVIAFALHELFGLDVDEVMVDTILVTQGALVLVLFDRLLPDHQASGRMPELWRRLAATIGAPFVSVMLAILVVYEITVLASGELPKNVLSPLIMAAGFVGFLCTLILAAVETEVVGHGALTPADPHHFLRRRTIRLARAFPAVLLLLLPMAVWALGVRIDQYGLTPFRVVRAASLLCLGLLGVAGTTRWLRGRGPLSWQVPAAVALFALVTAFGPLSAVSLSTASQSRRLERLLVESGVSERKVVPTRSATPIRPTGEQVDQLRDAIEVLVELDGERALGRVLHGDLGHCTPRWNADHCLRALGVDVNAPDPGTWASARSDGPYPLPAGQLRFLDLPEPGPSVLEGAQLRVPGGTASLADAIAAAHANAPLPSTPIPIRDAQGAVVGHLAIHQIDVRRWADGTTEVTRLAGTWLSVP